MLYIGMDVHGKWMTIRGIDPETGEIVEIKKIFLDKESLDKVFSAFDKPIYGVMESGTNSFAVYRMLEEYFEELIVVDPAEVWGKVIRRGAKTDRKDALKLAEKLYRGELNPLYIPDIMTQDRRILTRGKIDASRLATKIVNLIGSTLRSWGVVYDCSLLSKRGEKVLQEAMETLPEHSKVVLGGYIELLRNTLSFEEKLHDAIKREANKDEQCKQLMSIPGIAEFTALSICAEIGDINRFKSSGQLVCYVGLSPSVFQSSDTLRYGKLNRHCNKYLKYMIMLRAQLIPQMSGENPFKSTYWRIQMRGKNHAKIAVGRQIVKVIFSMLKNKSKWDPLNIQNRRQLMKLATITT